MPESAGSVAVRCWTMPEMAGYPAVRCWTMPESAGSAGSSGLLRDRWAFGR